MKKLFKILALSLTLVMGGFVLPANAGAAIYTPMFSNINYFINSIDITSDGEAFVYSYISVRNADTAAITTYLEKYNSTTGTWSSVRYWSVSENTSDVYIEESWWVVHGKYRVRSIGKAIVNGKVVESTTGISPTYTY